MAGRKCLLFAACSVNTSTQDVFMHQFIIIIMHISAKHTLTIPLGGHTLIHLFTPEEKSTFYYRLNIFLLKK